MIQNERQYQVTKEQLARLEASHAQMQEKQGQLSEVPAVIIQGQLNSLQFLMDDLRGELVEYEKLRAGKIKSLPLNSLLQDIPATLVRARIMRGWTHKQLAQALGSSEQQVQKDEAGGYSRANLEKLTRVAQALEVNFTGQAKLASRSTRHSTRSTASRTPR